MELVGKGLTAEVFKLDEDKVLKLFFKGYPLEAISREYENARLVNSFGINAPVAYELKNIEDRTGIVYSYVKGKNIEEVFDSQVNLQFFLAEFCKLQKSFFCNTEESLLSYKDYGIYLVNERMNDKAQALEAVSFINSFPDSNTVIHGDFHPLNVLVDSENNLKVIDFMNVMRAPEKYDIARTYYLISTSSKEFADAYLSVMGFSTDELSQYIELVKLFRKLEG